MRIFKDKEKLIVIIIDADFMQNFFE